MRVISLIGPGVELGNMLDKISSTKSPSLCLGKKQIQTKMYYQKKDIAKQTWLFS